jgi:arylsulfatase A-like enzyme
MNGSHRPDGVLILAGPDVQPGARLGRAQIVDVAPTLLRLLDLPLPSHFDGRVLAEALDPERRAGERDRHKTQRARCEIGGNGRDEAPAEGLEARPYSAREAAIVDERLRGLGYRG